MSNATTLSQLGITRDQSSKWQKLAGIPEERFELLLSLPGRPSTEGILRAAQQEPTNAGKDIWIKFCDDGELLASLNGFRFKYRFESRSEAARWLIKAALDAKLRPDWKQDKDRA